MGNNNCHRFALLFFMMGKSNVMVDGKKATTIIGAIIEKLNGRWEAGSSTVAAVRMKQDMAQGEN